MSTTNKDNSSEEHKVPFSCADDARNASANLLFLNAMITFKDVAEVGSYKEMLRFLYTQWVNRYDYDEYTRDYRSRLLDLFFELEKFFDRLEKIPSLN